MPMPPPTADGGMIGVGWGSGSGMIGDGWGSGSGSHSGSGYVYNIPDCAQLSPAECITTGLHHCEVDYSMDLCRARTGYMPGSGSGYGSGYMPGSGSGYGSGYMPGYGSGYGSGSYFFPDP